MARALGIVNNLTHALFETTPVVRSSFVVLMYYPKSLYQTLRGAISSRWRTIKCDPVSPEELREIQRQHEIRKPHGYEKLDDNIPYF